MYSRNPHLSQRRSSAPRAVTAFALARPIPTIAIWALAAVVSIFGLFRLDVETSTDSVLDRNSHQWDFYQESIERFGGDEIITVLFEAEEPFDRASLEQVRRLTHEFETLAGVWRVDSLATVPLIRADDQGGVVLSSAIGAGVPTDKNELDELIKEIQHDRIAVNSLTSRDGKYLAVNVVLEANAQNEYGSILQKIDEETRGLRSWISGVPIFRVKTDEWTQRELIIFVPVTVLLVGLISLGLLRDPRVALIPLISSGTSSVILLGIMGFVGQPLTISTVILPSVLLALGCAYAMHPLTAISTEERSNDFDNAMLDLAFPIALSGLTTALGFISLSLVRIPAIQGIGVFGGIGVVVVLGATLTLVPALLKLVPVWRKATGFRHFLVDTVATRVVTMVVDKRRILIGLWLLMLCVVGIGITRLRVQTDVVLWFPEEDSIRVSYDSIRAHLSGISPMNIVVRTAGDTSVVSTGMLSATDEFSAYLGSLPEVGNAISVADPIRELAEVVDPAGFGEPPGDNATIEQFLLLLESSEYLRDFVTGDRIASNIALRINENGSDVLLGVSNKAERWWERHGLEGASIQSTGIMYEFARAQRAIAVGQIRGLVFVMITVAGILLVAFRNTWLAAVALVPNAIPITVGFGAMGLGGISLDAGTVVVGSIAFGIAVDDTIHAITEYMKQSGNIQCTISPIVGAFVRITPAIVFSTVIVSIGFLVLAFSNFALIRNLGIVTSLVMFLCLVANITLLPALLASIDPDSAFRHVNSSEKLPSSYSSTNT